MADVAAPTPDDDQLQTPAPVNADIAAAAEPVASAEALTAEAVSPESVTPESEIPPAAAAETPAAAAQPPAAAEAPAIEEPAAPEPEPVAPPAAASIPTPVAEGPSVASTIDVPARAPAEPAAAGEGGEWELLVQKVGTWLSSGQLMEQWQAARQPLSLLAGLIALLLVLRIYGALLGVIESLPLLPGLLELVGVIAVVRFSVTRLVRSDERRSLIEGLQQRWKAFRGKG